MTDDRDICERLEDTNYDGAFAMRREAAKLIRQLRHYVDRLEDDLREADLKTESLRKHIAKQQLDIVTLGQEVGRLREALGKITQLHWFAVPAELARAALGKTDAPND